MRAPKQRGVEANAAGNAFAAVASIAERQGDGPINMSRQYQHRCRNMAAAILELHQVARLQFQVTRRGWADQGGVVPSELGHRIRQLLQPGIVGEATVVNLVVGGEADLQSGWIGLGQLLRSSERRTERTPLHLDPLDRRPGSGNDAVRQPTLPLSLEVHSTRFLLPKLF